MHNDLTQEQRDLIAAVLDGKQIEMREKGGTHWGEPRNGAIAVQIIAKHDNWTDHEFRVRPKGLHGYVRFSTESRDPLDFANCYSALRNPLVEGELALHIELDPDDRTIIRTVEIIKPVVKDDPEAFGGTAA